MAVLTGKDILTNSSESLDFSTPQGSYSPMFSTIGLQISEHSDGIGALWIHYNRATRAICEKLFDFDLKLNKKLSDVCNLFFGDEEKNVRLSFCDTDAFIIEADGIQSLPIFRNAKADYWLEQVNNTEININGYSVNPDARDPDEKVGFVISLKAQKGIFISDKNQIKISASDNGRISLKFLMQTLEISEEKKEKFISEKISFSDAENSCRNWFEKHTKNFEINVKNETEKNIICTAVFGLLFNASVGQGMLSKHVSAYPNRGGYPTHFIWDTYFQNLAYEKIDPFLAEEFLLQIIANQRPDGKFPQFMCSTWARPHDTQPALFGWAAKRLLGIVGNRKAFIEKIAEPLERNNQWWLTQRMTKYGCIFCPDGLETGQDDSPRFDNGATLAADMNSYLLNQLKFTAEIFNELGDKNKTEYWNKKSEKLEEKIIENLYDENRNIFFDFSLTDNRKIEIISPSSLLPLWAGIRLPQNKEKEMMENYLLNPEMMFSDIPFPSIAYNEDVYDAAQWWRGPTWLPIAWLMLETLQKYGYVDAYMTAVNRLYEMLIKDRDMHELFNSETGEGMGNLQQGWTCAVFIKFCEILNR